MSNTSELRSTQEQKEITSKNLPELVFIKDNRPTTTSLKVADSFEKRHDHIVRDIEQLIENTKEFNAPKFGVIYYTDGRNRKKKAYEFDRDGFTLLAMGFTGIKALKFKLDYIAAFNAMEKKLVEQSKSELPNPIQDSEYVTTFANPTVVMMIRKKNIQDNAQWRFVDFDASLMFGVKADNTITMSEYQFTKAMDMIGWELKSTLAEGFNTPTSPAKRIEIQDVFKPDKPDKFKELEESQKMLKIELAAATSQVEEIKALRVAEEAIRTKAQIGDKKVASAMGKAGALSKKNKKLQQENLRLKRLLLEKNIFDSK